MRAQPVLLLAGMIGAVFCYGMPAQADTIYDNGVLLAEVDSRISVTLTFLSKWPIHSFWRPVSRR